MSTAILWALVGLPRPDDPAVQVYAEVATSSFPSGHVATTVALWGLLALLGHIPTALAIAITLLSMVSRLYLGVHFLGDVLGGLVIGAIVLGVFYKSLTWLTCWAVRQPFRVYLAIGGISIVTVLLGIPFVATTSHPEFWGGIGWAIGGVVAGLLEYRFVRFVPTDLAWPRQALKIVLGLSGLALLLIGFLALNAHYGAVAAFPTAALAALWAIFMAPLLFACAGLGHAVTAGADQRKG